VHAVVARSTFPNQNVQNTCVGKLLEVEMTKKWTPLWQEAHTRFGALFEIEMSKKCTPLWREAHFQVKMLKFRCDFAWQAQGIPHLATSEQNVRVWWHFQN